MAHFGLWFRDTSGMLVSVLAYSMHSYTCFLNLLFPFSCWDETLRNYVGLLCLSDICLHVESFHLFFQIFLPFCVFLSVSPPWEACGSKVLPLLPFKFQPPEETGLLSGADT